MTVRDTTTILNDVKNEQEGTCCANPKNIIGIEYPYGHAYRYDGMSEIQCQICKTRRGRWSGKVLKDGEFEPRYGREPDGK